MNRLLMNWTEIPSLNKNAKAFSEPCPTPPKRAVTPRVYEQTGLRTIGTREHVDQEPAGMSRTGTVAFGRVIQVTTAVEAVWKQRLGNGARQAPHVIDELALNDQHQLTGWRRAGELNWRSSGAISAELHPEFSQPLQ
jgi:hypothetical protein